MVISKEVKLKKEMLLRQYIFLKAGLCAEGEEEMIEKSKAATS